MKYQQIRSARNRIYKKVSNQYVIDHTLVNVYIPEYLDQLGYKGRIVDDFSDMELVKDTPVLIDDSYSCFSVLNITGTLQDITIENAKYPLQNAAIQ